jgi:hypothetical protein
MIIKLFVYKKMGIYKLTDIYIKEVLDMSRDRVSFRSIKEEIERKDSNYKAKQNEEKNEFDRKREIEKSKEHR